MHVLQAYDQHMNMILGDVEVRGPVGLPRTRVYV